MSFLLYSKELLRNGCSRYKKVQTVHLAGRNGGLVYSAIKSKLPMTNCAWTLERTDLLTAADIDPDTHALMVDLKPSATGIAMVFEIESIRGFTYASWTPIMLCTRVVIDDKIPFGSEESKKSDLVDSEVDSTHVYTFLYLAGGYAEGDWRWGKVGTVNGALIYPDAWKHFTQR